MARELQDILSSGEITDIRVGGAEAQDVVVVVAQLDSHKADYNNPHQVDKADVGLDQVDNTSDADKPLSDETVAAIEGKADITYVDTELSKKQDVATFEADMNAHLYSGDIPNGGILLGGTNLQTDVVPTLGDLRTGGSMNWKGAWDDATTYEINDVVRDGAYLSIANTQTTEKPAPTPTGPEFYWYQGTGMVTNQASGVKQIVFGSRYRTANPFFLNGYRIKVVAGNSYEILSVEDPEGAAQATFINSFTAEQTGWRSFGLVPRIITAGRTTDVLAIVSQPDPAPSTFTGTWDYSKPQKNTVPGSGEVTHSQETPSVMYVHSRDGAAADRTAELQTLDIGDKILVGSSEWAIQSINEGGTDPNNYFLFGVAPATLAGVTGSQTFTFETTTPVDISYDREDNYYVDPSNVKGVFVADGDYKEVVEDDNAYGVDLLVQDVILSTHWDILAISEGLTGASGSSPSVDLTYDYSKVIEHVVAGDTYEEVNRLTVDRPAGTYEIKMSLTYTLNSTTTSAFFRWSTDGGTTWNELRREPKDVTDAVADYYSYPIEWGGGVFDFVVQMRKENASDVLTANFLDLIFERKL